jgi:hypothetical protein
MNFAGGKPRQSLDGDIETHKNSINPRSVSLIDEKSFEILNFQEMMSVNFVIKTNLMASKAKN